MRKSQRFFLFFAGLFGAFAIALAAIGAHAFHDSLLQRDLLATFQKAVDYSVVSALALLALTALLAHFHDKLLLLIGCCWVIGNGLFSGSLFFYTLSGIHSVVILTPFGGSLLIFGWLLLALWAIVGAKSRA